MRSIPLLATAILFSLGIGTADATDAVRLAERGGFLLGHAYRCGVATNRVVAVGRTIRELIGATAAAEHETDEADTRFAEYLSATASADQDDRATPVCRKVIAEFKKLERHRWPDDPD